MATRLALLLGIFFAWILMACHQESGHEAEFFVFGTLVEVQLPDASEDQASEIFGQLQQAFQRMHREWHAWEPGALVSLNTALQAGQSVSTTPDLVKLVRLSQTLEKHSEGHFNPAIGKLIELWGFHTSEYPILGPPPAREAIRALLESGPGSAEIVIEDGLLRCDNSAVQLDFGGIAKGYAVDLAISMIRQAGQESAIVNAGGDLRAIGDNHKRPWSVGVRGPDGTVAGGIEIYGDQAVFTSGNYTRFREDAGERYAHILDPFTGWPVDSIAAATVVAENGALADATATAIMVAGPKNWEVVAENMGVTAAMVINESGVIHATPEMMRFFTPTDGREVRVVSPR